MAQNGPILTPQGVSGRNKSLPPRTTTKEDEMENGLLCPKCFREDCRCVAIALEKDEHRGSRMPEHMASVPPYTEPGEEDIAEKEGK